MNLISEEYAKVKALNRTIRGSNYFSNPHKDHAEWHLLGAAQSLCAVSGHPFPTHACKGERPDFKLYTSGTFERGLEVTRVMPSGYKAQQHHREAEMAERQATQGSSGKGWSRPKEYPGYKEHWAWLRNAIQGKLRETYIANCDLLVYFNVSIGDTVEPSMDFTESIQDEWLRCPAKDFRIPGLGNSGVHSVMVLSSGLDVLATVYPDFNILDRA